MCFLCPNHCNFKTVSSRYTQMFQSVHHSTVYTTETHTRCKASCSSVPKRRHEGAVHTTYRYGENDTIQSSGSSGAKRTQLLRTLNPRSLTELTPHAPDGPPPPPLPAHAGAAGGARVPESKGAPRRRSAALCGGTRASRRDSR